MLNGRVSAATINYNIIPEKNMSQTAKDPYASISIQDMTKTEAKAQFEG